MITNYEQKGGDQVKAWTIRIPAELMQWIREKSAMATIKEQKQVSMNSIAIEILTKAMKADQKKKGSK